METKTNYEVLNESAKIMEKLFNNTNSAITEVYKKQMDLAASFFYNLLNSSFGNSNIWNHNNSIPNMFFNTDFTKLFVNPLTNFSSNHVQNPFIQPMDKLVKQIADFNQNLFLSNGTESNWDVLSEKYKELVNARMEASKQIITSISEAFNEHLATSLETNKKTMNEVNQQMETIMEKNQKLWLDLFKSMQAPLSAEENKNKERSTGEIKKRSGASVTA